MKFPNANRRQFLRGTAAAGAAIASQPALQSAALGQNRSPRLIVDSQVHLWPANTPERPWAPNARPQLPEPFTIERLVPLMEEAGVGRVVIVPPTLEGERLDYAQEAVRRYPGRFAIMGRIALDKPDRVERVLSWKNQPGVLGVRLSFTGARAAWLTDGTPGWFWPAAEKAGVPVMFLTDGQSQLVVPIAERHPQLPLIIDHMSLTSQVAKRNGIAEAIAASAALAKYPNVSVKLSSAPLFSSEPYPFRDMTPHIRRLFEAYGPQRCYWGTDITNSFAKASYRQRVTHFTEELDFLSDDDKDWIMGRAIVARLGWT
jgi:predicted TIM-barrel fold metal-dependent hydrolase